MIHKGFSSPARFDYDLRVATVLRIFRIKFWVFFYCTETVHLSVTYRQIWELTGGWVIFNAHIRLIFNVKQRLDKTPPARCDGLGINIPAGEEDTKLTTSGWLVHNNFPMAGREEGGRGESGMSGLEPLPGPGRSDSPSVWWLVCPIPSLHYNSPNYDPAC